MNPTIRGALLAVALTVFAFAVAAVAAYAIAWTVTPT